MTWSTPAMTSSKSGIAPLLPEGETELPAVSRGAPGVGDEDQVPLGGQDLGFGVESDAVHAVGAAVDPEEGGIPLAFLEARWEEDPPFDLGTVGGVEVDVPDFGQLAGRP